MGGAGFDRRAWHIQCGCLNHNTTEDLLEIQLNLRGFIFNEFNDYVNVSSINKNHFLNCNVENMNFGENWTPAHVPSFIS